jgi:hypothetical protein
MRNSNLMCNCGGWGREEVDEPIVIIGTLPTYVLELGSWRWD